MYVGGRHQDSELSWSDARDQTRLCLYDHRSGWCETSRLATCSGQRLKRRRWRPLRRLETDLPLDAEVSCQSPGSRRVDVQLKRGHARRPAVVGEPLELGRHLRPIPRRVGGTPLAPLWSRRTLPGQAKCLRVTAKRADVSGHGPRRNSAGHPSPSQLSNLGIIRLGPGHAEPARLPDRSPKAPCLFLDRGVRP